MTFGHTSILWCSRWHEFVKLFHIVLVEDQTRNSNIRLRDQIVETLFSCYDDFPLHSKILWTFQMFQTYVSFSRYTYICSNHLSRSENNDTRLEPQHSSDRIHRIISSQSVARSIVPENGVLFILPMGHDSQASNNSKSSDSKSPSAWSFFMRFYTKMT